MKHVIIASLAVLTLGSCHHNADQRPIPSSDVNRTLTSYNSGAIDAQINFQATWVEGPYLVLVNEDGKISEYRIPRRAVKGTPQSYKTYMISNAFKSPCGYIYPLNGKQVVLTPVQ